MKKTSTEHDRMKAALKQKGEASFGRAQAYAPGPNQGGPVVDPQGSGTEDTVPTVLASGEYVLPADTVEQVGVENLEALKQATHQPLKNGGKVRFGCADGGVIQAIKNRPRRIDEAVQADATGQPRPTQPPPKTIEQQTQEKIVQPAKEMVDKVKKMFGMADGGVVQTLKNRRAQIDGAVEAAVTPPPATPAAPAPAAPARPASSLDAQVEAQMAAARAKVEAAKPQSMFGRIRSAVGLANGGMVWGRPGDIMDPTKTGPSAMYQARTAGAYDPFSPKPQGGVIASPQLTMMQQQADQKAAEMAVDSAAKAQLAPATAPAAAKPVRQTEQGWSYQNGRIAMADGGAVDLEEQLRRAAAPVVDAGRALVRKVLPRPPGGETPEDKAALDKAIAQDNPFDVAAVPVIGFGATAARTAAAAPGKIAGAAKDAASWVGSKFGKPVAQPAAAATAQPAAAAAAPAAKAAADDGIPVLTDAVSGMGVKRVAAPLNQGQIAERAAAANAAKAPVATAAPKPAADPVRTSGAGKFGAAAAATGALASMGIDLPEVPATETKPISQPAPAAAAPTPQEIDAQNKRAALAGMGVSVQEQNRGAIDPDQVRDYVQGNVGTTIDRSKFMPLGNYGVEGQQIFGRSNRADGKINDFVGVGNGAKPGGYVPKGVDLGIKPGEVEQFKRDLSLGPRPDAFRNPLAYKAWQDSKANQDNVAAQGQAAQIKAQADFYKAINDGNKDAAAAAAARAEADAKRVADNAKGLADLATSFAAQGYFGDTDPKVAEATLNTIINTKPLKLKDGRTILFKDLSDRERSDHVGALLAAAELQLGKKGLFSTVGSVTGQGDYKPLTVAQTVNQVLGGNFDAGNPFTDKYWSDGTGRAFQPGSAEVAKYLDDKRKRDQR